MQEENSSRSREKTLYMTLIKGSDHILDWKSWKACFLKAFFLKPKREFLCHAELRKPVHLLDKI